MVVQGGEHVWYPRANPGAHELEDTDAYVSKVERGNRNLAAVKPPLFIAFSLSRPLSLLVDLECLALAHSRKKAAHHPS